VARISYSRTFLCFFVINFLFFFTPISPSSAEASHPWQLFRNDTLHTGRSANEGAPVSYSLWNLNMGSQVLSSPVINEDEVIYGASYGGLVFAVNSNGSFYWSRSTGSFIFSSPSLDEDGNVYIGVWDKLKSYTSSGSPRWTYDTDGVIWSSVNITPNGSICFSSQDRNVYMLNNEGGLIWSYEGDDQFNSTPAIDENSTIYIGCMDNNLYALNSDGTLKWSFSAGDGIQSSPSINFDGSIVFGSLDDKIYSLNYDGTKKWDFPTGGDITSSPAVGEDGTIYIGSQDGNLYSIFSWGWKNWNYPTGNAVNSSPALSSDGMVFVGSNDGWFYGVNSDGSHAWKYNFVGMVSSSPAIGYDGRVYVGSGNDRLHAIAKWIPSSTPTASPTSTLIPTSTVTHTPSPTPSGSPQISTPTPTPSSPPPSFIIEATPDPFSPDGDDIDEIIYFSLYGNSNPTEHGLNNCKFEIFDLQEKLIKRWTFPGLHYDFVELVEWDGYDRFGTLVYAGDYVCRLSGNDAVNGQKGQIELIINVSAGSLSPTPTATKTGTQIATNTPLPTRTPTPEPVRPLILVGGYLGSDITSASGGFLDIIAWASDPHGRNVSNVEVLFQGISIGLALPSYDPQSGIFWLRGVLLGSGGPPGKYLLEMVASTPDGRRSNPWPYLHILEESGDVANIGASIKPWYVIYEEVLEEYSKGANRPQILAAGYFDTTLSEEDGGDLRIMAFCADPDGLLDIERVELMVSGIPTEFYFFDDGLHGDFARDDGVYGVRLHFHPLDLQGAAGRYLLEIRAKDYSGNYSNIWPYLTIQ